MLTSLQLLASMLLLIRGVSECVSVITCIHYFAGVPVVAGFPAVAGIHAVARAIVTALAGVLALDDGLLLFVMQYKLPVKHGIAPLSSP